MSTYSEPVTAGDGTPAPGQAGELRTWSEMTDAERQVPHPEAYARWYRLGSRGCPDEAVARGWGSAPPRARKFWTEVQAAIDAAVPAGPQVTPRYADGGPLWRHVDCGGVVYFGLSGGYCTACEAEDLVEDEYTRQHRPGTCQCTPCKAAAPAGPQALSDQAAELDGFRKALRAIHLGIASPSPRTIAGDALNGRYFDPDRDAGTWQLDSAPAVPAECPVSSDEPWAGSGYVARGTTASLDSEAPGEVRELAGYIRANQELARSLDDATQMMINLGDRPGMTAKANELRRKHGLEPL